MDKDLTSASSSSSVTPRIDSNNEPEIYCIWCTDYNKNSKGVFVIETKKFKKDYLDVHLNTTKYQKAALTYTTQLSDQTELMSGFTIQSNINKLDIIAKMRCVYLYVKKHLAVDAFPNLVELSNLQEKNRNLTITDNSNNQANYATYKNPIAGANFLHAIAMVVEESVLNEVCKSSHWSLLIDESNTITYDKTCAIVSKHMAENILMLYYLGLIELLETDTNFIIKNLENFFVAKMLNIDNLMYFGSDDANVMLGSKNGVSAKLKQINPFITNCHCIAYKLNLVRKDSAKEVSYFKDYEVTLKEIYAYFGSLHQRWQHLKIFQILDEDPQLSVLHVVNIW
ncbi:hypothetical protein RclHR1_00840002 [Rhizophagus clarus]|uniref:DUF4371 domain-containing protein n=1 Tax=Rhizophagus clarus TaxID=94130 RepID=A0A2Z6S2Q5_9GLOM|nr:hypothetical protein RclHR1_00840002 [Rhizophagus clarus]